MTFDRNDQRAVPLGLLIAIAIAVVARIAIPEPVYETLVSWVPHEKAQALAREQGKPILYDFTADWCPPCKRMEREAWSNEEIAGKVNRELVPVRVDLTADESRLPPEVAALKRAYRVEAFPTLVVVGSDGNELRRDVGYVSRARLERFLAGEPIPRR